ncbi:hypothetical protein MBLNU230_g0450t1 [Neophaeotheca triangularis]
MTLTRVDWMNYWDLAWSGVGEGAPSWSTAASLASARLFASIVSNLGPMYGRATSGWESDRPSLAAGEAKDLTCLFVSHDHSPSQSFSLLHRQYESIWDEAKTRGLSYAEGSLGILGTANLTVGSLSTSCTSSDAAYQTLGISYPGQNIVVANLPYSGIRGNDSVTCTVTYRSALAAVGFWRGGTVDDGEYHTAALPSSRLSDNASSQLFPLSEQDSTITAALATQISSMLPSLDGLSPNGSYASFLSLLADRLTHLTSEQTNNKVNLDIATTIQPAIAYTFQHMLTHGNWNWTTDTNGEQVQHLLRFYVYGSGPREQWQWVALVILLILALVCVYDLLQSLRHAFAPGPWLAAYGMMRLANSSDRLRAESDLPGERTEYWIQDAGGSRLEISNHSSGWATGKPIDAGTSYSMYR